MATGQYIKLGSQWGTTYEQKGDAMYNMIDDFYNGLYQAFSPASKSMGAATYGDNGYFNAIMGKEITTGMFSSKNVFTLLGARPYNHEGVRIAYEQADYGCDPSSGEFLGIGAGTIQDGDIGDPYMIPVEEFREPYKEVPFPWDYGLGLMALEAKDDVSSYQDYAKLISQSYSNLIDQTLLRPMSLKQPTVTKGARTIETSLQGIARCIGSFKEIGKTENGVTIDAAMVTPYGGAKSDFYDFRSAGESVFDGNVVDLQGNPLDLDHMDSLWAQCSVNWDDPASPNNKAWVMGNIMQAKLSAMFRARNIQIDNVFVERGFNGVKTIQGRPGGTLINAYNNVPMFQDGNVNFDFTKKKVSASKMGDIMLLDMDHIWMSTLSPVEVYSNNNIAISRKLQEVNVIHCRMETRIDKFIGMGRIIGIPDAVTI